MKKIKLAGIVAISVIGTQVPIPVISANAAANPKTSITNLSNYNSDEIYNNLSDELKKVYIQDKNSNNESADLTRGIKKSVVAGL
jgi:hypothetical protein